MAGATIAGGEYGNWANKRSRDKAGQALRDSRNQWAGLDIPDEELQRLELEEYGDPELEAALMQDPTEYGNINLDPATRDAQMQALARLQSISEQGGMDSIDRARMSDIMGQAGNLAQGQRGAIAQNMQARGMAGSGLELVQQQMANQNAAQMANTGGLNTAAAAQQRALDAIMNAGQLGGRMRGQDYGQAADRASAQDAINSFNIGNRQGVQGRNVDRGNAASAANTDLRNTQQQHNKSLAQQRYENQVAQAQGMTGANQAISDRYTGKAQDTQRRHSAQGKAQDDMAIEGMRAYGSTMSL